MHLADVIQCRMGLVAVAWAQLKKQGLADGMVCQAKNFTLDLVSNDKGVRPCACSTKTGRLELNRAVLKGMVKDLGLNLLWGQHTEVSSTKKCSQIICAATVIGHLACGLR